MTASRHADQPREVAATLAELAAPVKPHLDALASFLQEEILSLEPEIREPAHFCIAHQGKQLRPLLVFLSATPHAAQPDADLVRAAAIIELIHLATLVHDDILDAADRRHNTDTAARRFGPDTAVLLGDALFSHALHLASQFPTVHICRHVSQATRRVCTGEITQTFQRRNPHLTYEDYLRIVDLKTGELFRVSCLLGSFLAGHSETQTENFARFGLLLGRAYQLYDDITDILGTQAQSGKTLGTDLRSAKMTLPLLLLLPQLPPALREQTTRAFSDQCLTPEDLLPLFEQYHIGASLQISLTTALEDAAKALLPHRDSPPAQALLKLHALLALNSEKLLRRAAQGTTS